MSPRRRQEGDDGEPAALDAHDRIALRRKVRAQTSTRRPDLRKRSDTNRVKKSSPQAEQLSHRPNTSNKAIKALVVPLDKRHERVSHTAWQALQASREHVPVFLMRVYSCDGVKHTNGFSSEALYLPAAAWHRLGVSTSMSDMPAYRAQLILGYHLLWNDRGTDELLSWTESPVFTMMHGWRRREKGQRNVFISMINRKLATNESLDKEVPFYLALDMTHALQPKTCLEWGNTGFNKLSDLQSRKFNHETLSHGEFHYPAEATRHASLEELENAGLFDALMADLTIPPGHEVRGLYTILHWYRMKSNAYTDVHHVTPQEMLAAKSCARYHVHVRSENERRSSKPSLFHLIYYLSLKKRDKDDRSFISEIKKLGYDMSDLEEGLYPNYEEVPDNLPEKASMMALLRAAHAAISNNPAHRPILPNRPVSEDRHSGDRYAAVDEICQQHSSLFKETILPDQSRKQPKSAEFVTVEDDAWASADATDVPSVSEH